MSLASFRVDAGDLQRAVARATFPERDVEQRLERPGARAVGDVRRLVLATLSVVESVAVGEKAEPGVGDAALGDLDVVLRLLDVGAVVELARRADALHRASISLSEMLLGTL